MMKGEKEVMRLLNKGCKIFRDCIIGETTFRVVGGALVRRFPLKLFEYLKEKEAVVQKEIVGICAVYALPKKKR